jgi:hypothetical protein
MKYILTSFLVCVIVSQSIAQTHRNINFKILGKDSVMVSLNSDYYLIEDSCAQIIRYSHFNFTGRNFSGRFKDVSKANPDLIVSEGNYTENGLKDGPFVAHYLTGALRAKGNFDKGKFTGKWQMYYDDGKPELTFEVIDNYSEIIESWTKDGTKTVKNGNGIYQSPSDFYWTGELVNGKPDSIWKFVSVYGTTKTTWATEYFKKGQFSKGSSTSGDYSDSSRIVLVESPVLSLKHVENIQASPVLCDGSSLKGLIGVQYKYGGLKTYIDMIGERLSPIIESFDISSVDNNLIINAEVSEKGELANFTYNNSFRDDMARAIIDQLRTMPLLEPANLDGKPIKQKIRLQLNFRNGSYTIQTYFTSSKLQNR